MFNEASRFVLATNHKILAYSNSYKNYDLVKYPFKAN